MDLGVTFFAMADLYGGGEVERIVGRAISHWRDELLIATQGGLLFDHAGHPTGMDGSPAHLARACDDSLRRLGTSWIDLYTLTRTDPRVPIEESVGALGDLVAAGKVRFIGLRGVTAPLLRRAHAEHPVTCVEGHYSLWDRQAETGLLPVARDLGIALVACEPLGRGFLTGQITSQANLAPGDARRADPRFEPGNLALNYSLLRPAQEMAAARDTGLGRLALAWLLAQGADIIPVPGTLSRSHAEMNVLATQVTLSEDERAELSGLLPADEVAGADEWRRRRDAIPGQSALL